MHGPLRLHALDNLRAVMMWLGIVLHVSLNHIVGPSTAPWRDQKTTEFADLLVAIIHCFRMPVFFILAGFFVAMLIERRGLGGMFKNRLRRLALPFVLFWPILFVLTILLAMAFVHQMVRGTWGLDPSIMPQASNMPIINTLHLWFLYLLFWYCVLTALLGQFTKLLPSFVLSGSAGIARRLASNRWGWLLMALPLAVIGAHDRAGIVLPGGSFAPPLAEWLHSGLFYAFGLVLYQHRDDLLARFARAWRASAVFGGVFFSVWLTLFALEQAQTIALPWPHFWQSLTYNCATWAWSFALIGAFTQTLARQNRWLNYIADSSYWVYLVHMLGTIGFGVLLYELPWPALLKMAINIAATSAAALLSYHLLVRHTVLGTLLNGRRAGLPARQA